MIWLELFLTFFKIGICTFGGGYAMLPLIQSEVISKGWMTSEELIDFIAVSESTPGPFAVNAATYIGARVGGVFEGFCATFGVILPSFIIILIIAKGFEKFQQNRIVKGCMMGLKPAVIGLIGSAVYSTAWMVFGTINIQVKTGLIELAVTVILAGITFFMALKKIHPIIIIICSAIVGMTAGMLGLY